MSIADSIYRTITFDFTYLGVGQFPHVNYVLLYCCQFCFESLTFIINKCIKFKVAFVFCSNLSNLPLNAFMSNSMEPCAIRLTYRLEFLLRCDQWNLWPSGFFFLKNLWILFTVKEILEKWKLSKILFTRTYIHRNVSRYLLSYK